MPFKTAKFVENLGRAWHWAANRFAERRPPPRATIVTPVRVLKAANGARSPIALPPLSLALQGGGAHGAFTWGAIDRLLEEPSLRIRAVSGSSAGALNAAVLAAGYQEGGPQEARARLKALWDRVIRLARISPLQPGPFERFTPGWNTEWSVPNMALELLTRYASPYQFNPLGLNPLRDILVDLIDFEALAEPDAIHLYIAATNLETSAGRIFTNRELTPEVLLASACVPTVHQAVRLDDGHYWDGGFSANPPLLPLIEHETADDIVLVRLNPAREDGVPADPHAIRTRVSRLVFEAPLQRELDAIDWLRRSSAKTGSKLERRLERLRIHTIADDAEMQRLRNTSKLHPDPELVGRLADLGRQAAGRWLAAFAAQAMRIGRAQSAPLEQAG